MTCPHRPSLSSGEAEYVDDQPALPGELYGHYVLSTVANAKIGNIDASKALVSAEISEETSQRERRWLIATKIPPSNLI